MDSAARRRRSDACVIVGLCSAYREGPLVAGAVQSLLRACDRVVVFEGPAGDPLEDEVPASDLSTLEGGPFSHERLWFDAGRWSTDAKKRTAMIEHLRPFEEPTWGVWVDGDEVLCNAEYLRDWINYWDWREEETGEKNLGWPIKIVEMDGSVAIVQAKVLRVDRLDSYSVSSSVFRDALGQLHGRGNYALAVGDSPLASWLRQLADPDARVFAWPPLPCEPFIMHRSKLRHPRRAGLRLHEQEATEIEKAKAAGLA